MISVRHFTGGFAGLILVCSICLPLRAQDTPQTATLPNYPESAAGLRKEIEDILAAIRTSDTARRNAYFESLILPDHDAWFRKVFGDVAGGEMAKLYGQSLPHIHEQFTLTFGNLASLASKELTVVWHDGPCNTPTTEDQTRMLLARQEKIALYDARFQDGANIKITGFFAFSEGRFRYLGIPRLAGAMRVWTAPPGRKPVHTDNPDHPALRGQVQRAELVHQAKPVFPEEARATGIYGVVRFRGVIGVDGTIQSLDLVSGPCQLITAAMNAVKQWKYKPAYVAGKPYAVLTFIDIDFKPRP